MRVGISLPVREMADDLGAIRDFAQTAEGLGLTHLRVPDQVIRPGNSHLHDPMMLLAYIAGITSKIELVPSVIVLPLRPTALFARQATELDQLASGRVRMGIGVGANKAEFEAMGVDFHRRGARCDEQLELLKALWSQETVNFAGQFEQVAENGINPRPADGWLPIWVGARGVPSDVVVNRIGRWADGWFVLASPDEYSFVRTRIDSAAEVAGRDPATIGTEAGVAVVGEREAEWQDRVRNWHAIGLTHLCLRTLGGGLSVAEHIPKMQQVVAELPIEVKS
ncbi:MAG: TIGR03619 family F420-dependent LLM class oxidoreductase [Pseudomonadales bacterium]|nr:TIGR03619 family F420-dependent LLM class oxidoreductase [Pseudomonadales bacterium]